MCKKLFLPLLVGALLCSPVHAGGKGKLRVLIVDGQNNHDWRTTTPHLKKSLEDCGRFTVDVATFLKAPADKPGKVDSVPLPPELGKYEVVLSNFNAAGGWPEGFKQDLDSRLKDGKIGLVIVHAANNAFTGWKEWNQMIGMGWRDKNFGKRLKVDDAGKVIVVPPGEDRNTGHIYTGPFTINIRDAGHPVVKGMPMEWLHARDELYDNLRGPIENVHLIATGIAPEGKGTGVHEPMIFTISYGKGRVFHTPMGHDLNAMRCVGFIATVQRGAEWAATGNVTIPIPDNFPTRGKSR
jgi:hypothetical protein